MALPALPTTADTRSLVERLNAIIRNIYNQMIPVGAAGTVLVSDGTTMAWGAAASSGTSSTKVTAFTASGTFTPDANCIHGFVVGIGGGGSAAGHPGSATGSGTAGGAEGNTVTTYFNLADVSPTVAVTVGSGGTPVTGAVGNAGGDTIFGALLTAKGGGAGGFLHGGVANTAGNVGDIVRYGDPGGMGSQNATTSVGIGGSGGGSGGGPGAAAGAGVAAAGSVGAANSGGGGGGTAWNNVMGPFGSAGGGSGYLYVVEFLA